MSSSDKIWVDGSAPTCAADDLNGFKLENNNLIEDASIVLSTADNEQTSKAVAQYVADGNYFTVSGTANAITLAAQSPRLAPPTLFNGLKARFRAASANTSTVTINVAGLGAKAVKKTGLAVALIADDIQADKFYEVIYNTSADEFELIKVSDAGIASALFLDNFITGIIPSNDTDTAHDINFSIGQAVDSTNTFLIDVITEKTKKIDVDWVAGDDQGGFPSGLTLSADTWYHLFVISNADGSLIDCGFDSSLTATNLLTDATGYTLYRRVGSVLTDGSSNIINGFWNETAGGGSRFIYKAPIVDSTALITSSAQLFTLSVPPNSDAIFSLTVWDNTGNYMLITETAEDDTAPSVNLHEMASGGTGDHPNFTGNKRVDSSSQIRVRGTATSDGTVLLTRGYIDERIA